VHAISESAVIIAATGLLPGNVRLNGVLILHDVTMQLYVPGFEIVCVNELPDNGGSQLIILPLPVIICIAAG
jgi:hypothetical protein